MFMGAQAMVPGGTKSNVDCTFIPSTNSFSVLDSKEIILRSNKMGVYCLDDSYFPAIDLLKDLELARCALSKKHDDLTKSSTSVEINPAKENPTIVNIPDSFGDISLDWDVEESSEVENYEKECFVLVASKRSRKPVQRLMLSSKKLPKKGKGNPSLRKKDAGKDQGIHGPAKPASKNKN